MKRPLLIVVSAPSGAGKSTLCRMLLEGRSDIIYSISCTTRAPRGHEKDGVNYHFLAEPEFERRVAAGEFLEHAVVHGHRYGTPGTMVRDAMASGLSVIMDIDVQGAAQIRKSLSCLPKGDPVRDGFVDIFIAPPSLQVLRARLSARGEDTPEVIERRMRNAELEMARASEYKYVVVNDVLETALQELKGIVDREMKGNG